MQSEQSTRLLIGGIAIAFTFALATYTVMRDKQIREHTK